MYIVVYRDCKRVAVGVLPIVRQLTDRMSTNCPESGPAIHIAAVYGKNGDTKTATEMA